MKSRRIKKVYGWSEQSGCAFGVHEFECDIQIFDEMFDVNNSVMFDEDGELCVLMRYDMPENGRYFKTFRQAKAACLKHWNDVLSDAKHAIKAISQQKAVAK